MGNSPNADKIRPTLAEKPTVVIVGGGYGGVAAAKELDKHINVVLIDKKNHFFHNIAALRPCVEPKSISRAMIPYDRLLLMGAFIQGEVESITSNEIKILNCDESIKFDYLVIATGSTYSFPMKNQIITASDVLPMYDSLYNEISKSNDIIIVGGGPVGLELLGEIYDKFNNKNITLIQGNEKIIPSDKIPDGLRDSILTRIKDNFKTCKVIVGERVNITDDMINELNEAKEGNRSYLIGKREIETNKGNKYNADIVFFATGTKLNNSAYSEGFKNAVHEETGRLKTNARLQVDGYENVFAVGDCAYYNGTSLGYYAGEMGKVAGNNILQHSLKKTKYKTFENPPSAMFVPLGRHQGAGLMPIGNGKIVGATIVGKLKGGDLFVSRYWSELGYKNASNDIISLTGEQINNTLTDQDYIRIAKGLQIQESTLRQLTSGSAKGTGKTSVNANNDSNPKKSEEKEDNDTEAQMKTVNDDVVEEEEAAPDAAPDAATAAAAAADSGDAPAQE